jgi:hypothetical protein
LVVAGVDAPGLFETAGVEPKPSPYCAMEFPAAPMELLKADIPAEAMRE